MEKKRVPDPIESLENWSILEANQASKTVDPGSVSLFDAYERKIKASDHEFGGPALPDYWLVHPSVYVGELVGCFHNVRLLVPLLISPYFLGDRLQGEKKKGGRKKNFFSDFVWCRWSSICHECSYNAFQCKVERKDPDV
jgi:hypothetical protein